MQKLSLAVVLAGALVVGASADASIIFDNFNAATGHFGSPGNTSGTTNILKPVATTPNANAVALTSDAAEGSQALKVTLEGGGQATPAGFPRVRFLSGGGTPASNTSFNVDPNAVDGFIGFYYKAPVAGTLPSGLPAGLQFQLNLDGPGGAAADADAGIQKNAIMDGQWHLVEWDLDTASDWTAFAGVGGDGNLTPGTPAATTSHTIDSIYFRYNTSTGWTGYTGTQDILIDFVAKSDSGSIANLIPEPSSLAVLAAGALVATRRRRRGA